MPSVRTQQPGISAEAGQDRRRAREQGQAGEELHEVRKVKGRRGM